ncbi:hypothetical protein [Actinoplanes sp. GCM10030250]|uniref:hypothetical protein n=1 Tax=Actinoplanes sp. GCM10030250 TaxID=3273376 RepID=UPI00366D39A9
MGIPGRPVPPITVRGTLAVNRWTSCAVVQIAYNGPTDGIEWRTVQRGCGRGRTAFRATSEYLWGGGKPQLRLCAGRTVRQAERGTACDVYTPRVN